MLIAAGIIQILAAGRACLKAAEIKKGEAMKKILFAACLGLSLTACVSVMPLHQTQSPASLGKGALSASALSSLYFSDFKAFKGEDGMRLLPFTFFNGGAGAAYGVTEKADVEAEILLGWQFNLGAKYQWLGSPLYKTKKGEWNSAFRSKASFTYKEREKLTGKTDLIKEHAEEMEKEKDSAKKIAGALAIGFIAPAQALLNITEEILANLGKGQKGIAFSAANSWGYMVRDWLAVYGGGQLIYQYMMYDFAKAGRLRFHFYGGGPFAGIQIHAGGPKHKVFWAGEGSVTGILSAREGTAKKETALIPAISSSLGYLYSFNK